MNIRLQTTQQKAIKQLASEYFENAKVFIFGSRTDMAQKGGDIDICQVSPRYTISTKLKAVA